MKLVRTKQTEKLIPSILGSGFGAKVKTPLRRRSMVTEYMRTRTRLEVSLYISLE